jgi:hypothetical protein
MWLAGNRHVCSGAALASAAVPSLRTVNCVCRYCLYWQKYWSPRGAHARERERAPTGSMHAKKLVYVVSTVEEHPIEKHPIE